MKNVIAFAGSNSSTSINKSLVKHVASLVTKGDVELVDLRDYDAPIYSADIEQAGFPQPVLDLVEKLSQAEAYIIATPEHNGSLSAFMKNIIDWASRVERNFFGGKPVLLLSTSGGQRGAASALEDLNTKMKYFAGEVKAKFSLGSYYDTFDQKENKITNTDEAVRLGEAIKTFEDAL